MALWNAKTSLVGAILAGIGASACCVAPLALLSLGVGGAWVGTLGALAPFQPLFVGLTVLFLGLAYHRLYRAPQACAAETPCADPQVARRQRRMFWWVAVLLAGLLAAPWLAALSY